MIEPYTPSEPFPTEKDHEESARVGRTIRAAPKQCWLNARKAVLRLAEYSGATLVEGWAVFWNGALPIEHGWVHRDGKIIDPTLPDDEGVYFPGLELTRAEILALKPGKEPVFFSFGWGGMKHSGMRRAYESAMTTCRQKTPA